MTFYGPYADIYKAKWEQAKKRIEDMGITVEYIDYTMFSKAASILYDGPWVAERWKDLGDFVESHPGKVFPVTETILRSGDKPEHTARKVFEAMHQLQEYRMRARHILKDAVLIMPTAGGTFKRDDVRKDPISTNSQMGLYTNHCNLLDMCAIAVPENTAGYRHSVWNYHFLIIRSGGRDPWHGGAVFKDTEYPVCGMRTAQKRISIGKPADRAWGFLSGKCKHRTTLQAVPSGYGTGKTGDGV